MTVTRNDKKHFKKVAAEKAKKAKDIKGLELVFAIGGIYVIRYYDERPIRRFLAKIGIRSSKVAESCMERARTELSDVDYNYFDWKMKYGNDFKI